jgi:predicted amidohydrolase YtcJ
VLHVDFINLDSKSLSSERYDCLSQPDHLLDDADSAGKKIGIERAERSSYLFRSLLSGGAHLAFGSDWPVCIPETSSVTENHFTNIAIVLQGAYVTS